MNKYTIWLRVVEDVVIPVHYEMRGYNSLLGSHYDHYYITYDKYSSETPDESVFADYKGSVCHGWPGPGAEHVYQVGHIMDSLDRRQSFLLQLEAT